MRSMIKATNNTRRMLQINKLLFKPNFSLTLEQFIVFLLLSLLY